MSLKEGLFIIDKTPGPTSFDLVRKMKKIYPGAKVGHTGSLDPFASGVMVLVTGKATKLSNLLLNADKSYIAKVRLGQATDTMDRTGEVTEEKSIEDITEEKIIEVLKGFEGTWEQTPPMYSAKKLHGVRLYELARQDIKVRRKPIPVQLFGLKLLSFQAPYVDFELSCSKGTYVRALADEFGRRLGTVAHLEELRRLTCGNFSLKDSVSVEDLSDDPEKFGRWGFQNYVNFIRSEKRVPGGMRRLPSRQGGGNSMGRAIVQKGN